MLTPASTHLRLSAAVLAVIVATAGPAAASTAAVPYADPAASGVIGLCDRAGNPVTHGSVTAKPFVFRAVSSTPAASPYDAAGRTATLYAFQPRQDVPAGDWSGQALTAATRYTNPAHPMAQATGGDDSLADYMANFSPSWSGLLQLRIFLGAPDATSGSATYPATDIQVTGDTWRVVRGGSVPCSSGNAQSVESVLLSHDQLHPAQHAGHRPGASHRQRTRLHRAAASTAPAGAAHNPVANAASQSTTPGGDNHDALIGVLVAFFLLLIGSVAIAARRKPDPAAATAVTTKESK